MQGTISGPFIRAISELTGVEFDPGASPPVAGPGDPAVPIGLWATVHGLVMLEINQNLRFIEDREELLVADLRRAIEGLRP